MNYRTRTPQLRLKLEGWRARALLLLLLLSFSGLAVRAAYLQCLQHDFLQSQGEARYSRVIEMPAHRGMVSDRNGEALAISTPVESVWASPHDVSINDAQTSTLAQLLGIRKRELKQKLADRQRSFVYLKRQLPPQAAAEVLALKIPGILLQREYRRYYPAGEVMAHLLGFTSVDDAGQEGVELAFQRSLAGVPGAKRVIKDRNGRIIEDVESIKRPQQGRSLVLSIDSKLQYLVYRELRAAVGAHRAQAGAVVVLDCRSGEVLALASFPDYNPNNRGKRKAAQIRNRPLTDTFEPGSTLKPFTVAAALEVGLITPASRVQTAPGRLSVGGATIHDAHVYGDLSVAEVIQKSSNVGAAKIALSLPAQTMWQLFSAVGFGAVPNSGFPGEAAGKVRPYQKWRPIEQATMSYGHGISVSLVQLARAYMVFASDGLVKPLSMVKLDAGVTGRRVLSDKTARAVSRMLELAVQPGGTAPQADVPGYRVAGKTGTAHKQAGTSYARDRYVSSFVGFAPASAPRFIVGVMIDEPSAGQYYGGAVAAPVFSKVMAGALRMWAVTPDAPLEEWSAPLEAAAALKEEA